MMRQISNESFADRTAIFASTQVALNVEFLSLMPSSIDQASFFIELAEEMDLTFCEQIDDSCPVLLGLWNNVLKAESKLEEYLHSWEQDERSVHYSKALEGDGQRVNEANEEAADLSMLPAEAHTDLESTCVVLPPDSQSYDPALLSSSPQLFIVSSDVGQMQASQLLRCTIADVKTALHNAEERPTQELCNIKKESDCGIKEIYVDIAVNPQKNGNIKHKTKSQCLEMKASEQHPLDKLCQLLCIEEDETIEKRLTEAEKRRKQEESLPYKYFCDQCSFKTKRENHLLKHAKLHEKIKDLFCCDECDFKAIRESVLVRHRMQHSTTHLVCKLCPYKTDRKKFLLKHVQVRHGPSVTKKVRCNYCDFVATTPRELHRHHKILHKPDNLPKLWKCSKCSYKSKLRAHLTRHENDVHGSLRQFLCHYCGKSFKRNDTLTQHKVIHGEVNKTYTCQQCGKVGNSAVFLREHLATHTTERPFLCDVCGSSFKTRGATQRHKRAMHSDNAQREFPCSQCDRSFTLRTDLNRHRKTHRLKAEATVVPAITSGASVQADGITTPITIQVVYTDHQDPANQDVTIK